MSNQGFTFPPPPPPPPKKDVLPGTPYGAYGQGNRGGSFNRGDDGGRGSYGRGRGFGGSGNRGGPPSGPRGGGRGQSFSRGASPSNGFIGHREWSQGYSSRGNGGPGHSSPNYGTPQSMRPTSSHGPTHLNPPQKRDHTTAFSNRGRGGPKPLAAPAVPSFLSSIPGLSPPAFSTALAGTPRSPMEKKLKLRTTNILGLNPSTQDPDSAPDDEDEEAKLASIITTTSQIGLTYEYNGQTATLKTPADIAAWVAERRKRYPTAAKAEQAKEKAEEKKRKYDEELIAKSKARRQQREEYEKKKESEAKVARWIQGGTVAVKEKEDDAAEKARLKTEKLIERAAKTQKKLVKAQNALKKAQQASASKQTPNTTFEDEEGFSGIMDGHAEYPSMQQSKSVDDLDVSSALTDDSDEATSSSGSSSEESDSESAPDVRTTKRAAPDRVLPPPRPTPPLGLALQNLCRNMMNSGVCKHGKRCKYSHVLPENLQPPAKERVEVSQVTGRPKRKGLWEIMVEKEKEEERRQVLRAVVELGDKGLLN